MREIKLTVDEATKIYKEIMKAYTANNVFCYEMYTLMCTYAYNAGKTFDMDTYLKIRNY